MHPTFPITTVLTLNVQHRSNRFQLSGNSGEIPQRAPDCSVAGSAASAGLVEVHWLCPIEDRHRLDSAREGMLEEFSLGNDLLLVNHSARLLRDGKTALLREVAEILDRLGTS